MRKLKDFFGDRKKTEDDRSEISFIATEGQHAHEIMLTENQELIRG